MSPSQRFFSFDCHGDTLAGALTEPAGSGSGLGVLIVVGGPQYRCGSHRQFVQLARALASAGHHVLRFDVRGMGDATGDLHDFLNIHDDIAAAASAFRREVPSVQRLVLWGLCDGASAALLYWGATRDPAIEGMVLLNPWVRSDASLAKAQVKQYYLQRIMQRDFWLKLLRGGVAVRAARTLAENLWLAFGSKRSKGDAGASANLPFQQRMAAAWQAFPGRLLLVISGRDLTAREFIEYAAGDPHWKGLLERDEVTRHDLLDADHTFSSTPSRLEVEQRTLEWLVQ